jgi:hypothetical protein
MSDTIQLTFTVNRDIFSALRQDPGHFVPELRLAALDDLRQHIESQRTAAVVRFRRGQLIDDIQAAGF